MDILTTKGQETLKDVARAKAIFLYNHDDYYYFETPPDQPSDIDAVIVKDQIVQALAEVKCRYDCDLSKFQNEYENRWLITNDKIERGKTLAKAMRVPLLGLLYIVQSDILLVQKICDRDGMYIPDIQVRMTDTQRSINGGSASRENAFIDMSKARKFEAI